jgi:hypothetical protein
MKSVPIVSPNRVTCAWAAASANSTSRHTAGLQAAFCSIILRQLWRLIRFARQDEPVKAAPRPAAHPLPHLLIQENSPYSLQVCTLEETAPANQAAVHQMSNVIGTDGTKGPRHDGVEFRCELRGVAHDCPSIRPFSSHFNVLALQILIEDRNHHPT